MVLSPIPSVAQARSVKITMKFIAADVNIFVHALLWTLTLVSKWRWHVTSTGSYCDWRVIKTLSQWKHNVKRRGRRGWTPICASCTPKSDNYRRKHVINSRGNGNKTEMTLLARVLDIFYSAKGAKQEINRNSSDFIRRVTLRPSFIMNFHRCISNLI